MLNRKGEGILGSGARWRALIRLNLKTVPWQLGWFFKWQNILHSSWKGGEGASSIAMKYIPSSYGENWIYIGITCCGRQPKVLSKYCYLQCLVCHTGAGHSLLSPNGTDFPWLQTKGLGQQSTTGPDWWSGQMPPHLSYQLKLFLLIWLWFTHSVPPLFVWSQQSWIPLLRC